MLISRDMIPLDENGLADQSSWTYKAWIIQSAMLQREGLSGPRKVPPGMWEVVVLPGMIKGIFSNVAYDAERVPDQYQKACDTLKIYMPHDLNWGDLPEQFHQETYPKLRRMLENGKFYQRLFNCKPGVLAVAWNQLVVTSRVGDTVSTAKLPSDCKTLFILHLSTGPEVELVPESRKPSTPGRQGRVYFRRPDRENRNGETRYPAALLGAMELLVEELDSRSPLDLQWCVEQLGELITKLQERPENVEAATTPQEPVRFLEPMFIVDMEPEPEKPKEP